MIIISHNFLYLLAALDQQKEMYEQKLEELRREKTPIDLSESQMAGRASSGYVSEDRYLANTPSFYDRYANCLLEVIVFSSSILRMSL